MLTEREHFSAIWFLFVNTKKNYMQCSNYMLFIENKNDLKYFSLFLFFIKLSVNWIWSELH